ncbi:MAG: type II toxin-antitoxin system HicB family antitoxin [Eubacteriales bacterium]|nr:type II toxin-antitoxin system HicB family antitoxin [Eubacteriales bacterium]
MRFVYPAVFKYEDDSFWVSFPDLDGCFSYGETAEQALLNAQEALALYLEPDTDNPSFPIPSKITDIENVSAPGFVSLVATDVKVDMGKSVRKNLTIPAWLNNKAEAANINFSQTLQEALKQKLLLQ